MTISDLVIIMLNKYIAHACGGINNITYSNSLEAIEQSYNLGYKFIEIDISKTNDGKYVLLHDWYNTRDKLFGKKGMISENTFLNSSMVNNLTQMNLDMVLKWLSGRKNIYLVSDTKNVEILEILEYINKFYPDLKQRIIPQIYFFEEYKKVLDMGYDHIILALYKLNNTKKEIINFISKNKLMAVSLSKKMVQDGLAFEIKKLGVDPIVYTVNDKQEEKNLQKLGVDTFFTDFLV